MKINSQPRKNDNSDYYDIVINSQFFSPEVTFYNFINKNAAVRDGDKKENFLKREVQNVNTGNKIPVEAPVPSADSNNIPHYI